MEEGERFGKGGSLLIPYFLTSLLLTSILYAQTHIPVQEKIQYEAALETKVAGMLASIIGPNHARISVEAIVEKPKESTVATGPEARFKWAGISQEPAADTQQFLPGFYAGREKTDLKAPDSAVFLPFLIKRINVNIVLDRNISAVQASNINEAVTELLNLDLKRGDTVNIVRAPFMSVWRTMLSNPDFAAMLSRYGLISVIVLFSMIVLAAAVFRLAGSMGSMAQVQQAHQIEMSFGGKGVGGGDATAIEGPVGAAEPAREDADAVQPAGDSEVIFNVKVKHVPLLKFVFEKEDPANIALIVAHLPPDTRRALLDAFDRELSSKILLNMAKVRFVEPEIILEIKEELERKINSAMGGVPKIIEFMSELGFRAKKDLIKIFEAQDPALARDIRSTVLLDDDLARLSGKDLSILISALTLSEWSDIIPALSEDFRAAIKAQLPERSWAIIEQMQVNAPSAEKMNSGLEKMVAAAEKLIKEGRIARPPVLSNLLASKQGQNVEVGS